MMMLQSMQRACAAKPAYSQHSSSPNMVVTLQSGPRRVGCRDTPEQAQLRVSADVVPHPAGFEVDSGSTGSRQQHAPGTGGLFALLPLTHQSPRCSAAHVISAYLLVPATAVRCKSLKRCTCIVSQHPPVWQQPDQASAANASRRHLHADHVLPDLHFILVMLYMQSVSWSMQSRLKACTTLALPGQHKVPKPQQYSFTS